MNDARDALLSFPDWEVGAAVLIYLIIVTRPLANLPSNLCHNIQTEMDTEQNP